MSNRRLSTFYFLLSTFYLVSIYAVNVYADGKKKKYTADHTTWNPYYCCHRLDDVPGKPGVLIENFLVPDFYYIDTVRAGDTTFAYMAYDNRDSVLNADTVMDFANVYFLSLFKSYIDHIHTYRDDNGKQQPLPVSLIIERYDRLSGNKWNHITYPGNQYAELKEFRNDIARIDTFVDYDSASHVTIESIYKYYRTNLLK